MPAGTDLITWAPRKGATGDDRYDPDASAIKAGNSTYSSPPTPDEVLNGSDLNQVIAYTNLRTYSVPASTGNHAAFSPLSYVTQGNKIKTTDWSAIKSRIDSMRIKAGQSAFSWTVAFTTGVKITRQHMLELRKAAILDYFEVYATLDYTSPSLFNYNWQIEKTGNTTYPPGTVIVDVINHVGQTRETTPSFVYDIYRAPYFFNILASAPATLSAAKFAFGYSYTSSRIWTLKLYRANTYFGPLDTGDWGNLDNLEDSAANNTLAASYAVNAFNIETTLTPGSGYAYTFVSSDDESGHVPADGPAIEYDNIAPPIGGVGIFAPHLRLYTA